MKPIRTVFAIVGTLAFSFAIAAQIWASEAISARVTSVDEQGGSLMVSPLEARNDMPDSVKLSLDAGSQLRGIQSLQELEAGDEVIFEGTQKSETEWTVRSLKVEFVDDKDQKKLAEKRNQPAEGPGFFENVKQQAQGAWYSFRSSVQTDRKLYEDYADKRLKVIESRTGELKSRIANPAEQTDADRAADKLPDIQARVDESRQVLNQLKSTQDEEAWKDAKSKFEAAASTAEEALRDQAEGILAEKDLYLWRVESELQGLRYDTEELEAAYKEHKADFSEPAEAGDYDRRIGELRDRVASAEAKYKQIKDAADWQALKGEMENHLYAARGQYYDLLGKIPLKSV